MTTLCICLRQVYCRYRIVPDHDISCVTLSSIDCALQMLQVLHCQFLTLVIFNSDLVSMQFRKHLAFWSYSWQFFTTCSGSLHYDYWISLIQYRAEDYENRKYCFKINVQLGEYFLGKLSLQQELLLVIDFNDFHMLNSIELLVREDNLLSNHGNQHMDITHQPWNHGYFVVACLQRYPLPL